MTKKQESPEELYHYYSAIRKKKRKDIFGKVFDMVGKKNEQGELWILEPGTGGGKMTSIFVDFHDCNLPCKIRYVGIEQNKDIFKIFNKAMNSSIKKKGDSWEYKFFKNVDEFYRDLDKISKIQSNVLILIEGDYFDLKDDEKQFDFIVLSFFISWLDRKWRKGTHKAVNMLKEGGNMMLVTGGGELFVFHRGSGEVIDLENLKKKKPSDSWDVPMQAKAEFWKLQLDLKKQLIRKGNANFKQLTPSDPFPILEELMISGLKIDEKNTKDIRTSWDRPIIDSDAKKRLEALILKDPFKYFDINIKKDLENKYKERIQKDINTFLEKYENVKINGRTFYDVFVLAK